MVDESGETPWTLVVPGRGEFTVDVAHRPGGSCARERASGYNGRMTRSLLAAMAIATMLFASGARGSSEPRPRLEEARLALMHASLEYRRSLERLLVLQAETARRAEATAESRRSLLPHSIVSRREVTESEQAAAAAVAAAARTQAAITEADQVVAEAEAVAQPAAASFPASGAVPERPPLLRHAGAGAWSLAMISEIERFFAGRFGRPLPVSALGQTPLHGHLGFDHRHAADVAVHPDTAEGQALLAWLRERDIPYLAFRGAVAGEATGAHVHIGEPSPRLAALPR
jgi:hypothetical protein